MQSQVPLLSFGCAHISHRIDSGRGCHLWETIEPFRFSRDVTPMMMMVLMMVVVLMMMMMRKLMKRMDDDDDDDDHNDV